MKAAVLFKVNEPLVVTDVNLDPPKHGEVMVRIVASGICASDLHVMDGANPRNLPIILGHEGAGVIEEVGEEVSDLKVGDHVIISLAPACGRCFFCAKGKPNLCERMPFRNEGALFDGTRRLHTTGLAPQEISHYSSASTFAEYTVVPDRACIKVSDDAPLEYVCLIACGVTTGFGAVLNTAKVEAGSSVAVFGCGGVGLNAVQASALAGAHPIIAVDVNPAKLELAKVFGATHTVDSSTADPVVEIQKITARGADYSFEVVGHGEVLTQAFASIRRGGTCVIVGAHPSGSKISIEPRFLQTADRSLMGCAYGSARPWTDIPMIVDLFMSGKIKLRELVSHTTNLDSINQAIELVVQGKVARSVIIN